ncbi:MAG: fructose bisphosphate aldolase [Acidimicrobiia bacterium]|nr:fructose bisphosphate aldolase [bacterium]MXX63995.1 fructose bisphosphate aldolase [Acidimicrobiia bacterium]MCY3651526.1 fructose bisphosphate aldolase [bacterium]MDE0642598.1 fructose bisphosphate aldolase [bacterium]MXZ06066.1 fructose bisphosphate aldolase [Acidimicrobiia bacterium]
MNQEQLQKVQQAGGFIAALDQSGGSSPKALAGYGVPESAYSTDEEMFGLIHEMRTRIITSDSFGGDRLIGAILFADTIRRQIEGVSSVEYLWKVKGVVPFLKADEGLASEQNSVQLMKPMAGLDQLLEEGREQGVFGTKMRSVIKMADPKGIEAIVEQQFEVGERILSAGLVPILEPEVDINSPEKSEAEDMLLAAIMDRIGGLDEPGVMFKLTIPDQDNLYGPLVEHPKVVRVAALSGGYSHTEACERLARQPGMVASFSRALLEGLTVSQSKEDFDEVLGRLIGNVYAASTT